MKKLRDQDAAAAHKGSPEQSEAYLKAKLDLIEAARDAENSDRVPEYLWPDETEDAWFHRKSAVCERIEKRGGFSSRVATIALTDPNWETKEAVASWLRKELEALRRAE